MNNLRKFHAFAIALVLLLAFSCGGENRTLLTAIEAEPVDFSLSNTRPEVFAFDIADAQTGNFDFDIELTYFENQMQGWDELPLYYVLKHPDGKEEDFRFNLQLKNEKGEWKGNLLENNADRKMEQTVKENLSLPAGKYEMKLFGDSKDLAKPILGIVRVSLKVMRH